MHYTGLITGLNGALKAIAAIIIERGVEAVKKKLGKKTKIVGAVVVLVLILIGAGVKMLGGQSTPQLSVTTVSATMKSIEESLTLKAPLEGVESVEIVSRLHYEVTQLNVKEGDRVAKGQLLAVLDSKNLQQDIQEAQASYEMSAAQYQEKIRNDQVAYDKALLEWEQARKDYEQKKALLEAGGISSVELQKAEDLVKTLEQNLKVYRIEGGVVIPDVSEQKRVEVALRQLEKKKKDLEDTQIKSTIDGTVTRVNIKVGRFADETDDDKPMFVIENLNRLQMKVLVSEYDIAKIREGQKATISADILKDETVQGVVDRISPTGEVKNANSTERVIPINIQVEESSNNLIAGITAKAKIEINRKDGVMVLPLETVMEKEDGICQIIRVQPDNTLHIIPVILGLESDLEVEIISEELQEDDLIVMAPELGMTEGMAVRTVNGR